MKQIIIYWFIFISVFTFAQREIQPEIGALVYTSQKGYYDGKLSYNSYDGLKISAGARFIFNKKSLIFNFQCQSINNYGVGDRANRKELKSQQLGLGSDLRLFEQKRVRLFFQLALLTEINSNYKNNYLRLQDYYPTNFLPYQISDGLIYTNIYKGTPFVGNFSIGGNLRIFQGLSFNATFGYGMRLLRSQYAKLHFDSNQTSQIPTKIENINAPYLVPFHMLDFQVGLSYAFSLKKKPKTEMP